MDKKEIYSLYQGMKLLEKEGIKIFGIEKDNGVFWSCASEQYPPFKREHYNRKIIKVGWHCHGTGLTPKGAIIDMIKQIKNYLKNK